MDIAALTTHAAGRAAPVLLLDTCAIGDILREAHRATHRGRSIEAARLLTDASSSGRLTICWVQTVSDEWQRNRPTILSEFQRAIRSLDQAVERIQEAGRHAGMPQAFAPINYEGLGAITDIVRVADSLVNEAQLLDRDADSSLRGLDRDRSLRRPSQRGKTVQDSEIIEHYLSLCRALRAAPFNGRCVFVSSNTSDYCDTDVTLHADLAPDFGAVALDFVTDLAWARQVFGI